MGPRGIKIAIVLAVLAALLLAFGRPHGGQGPGNILVVDSQSAPDHLDTALAYQIVSWTILVNTNDGLLTYPKAAGQAGSKLAPDLASAMPTVSADGLTWTFHVRTNVEWGPPLHRDVEPSDIKWGIERGFEMASPGLTFYTDITGATAFQHKQANDIAGIVADDAAHTIVFHLDKPNPVMGYLLALPFSFAVPREIPATEQGRGSSFIPSTGPYMFTKYVPNEQIVLRRNPNFHPYSSATPRGSVDGIDVDLGIDPENAVTMIQQGQSDMMLDQLPSSKMAMLLNSQEWSKQIHVSPTARTFYMYMDTQVPPFNNVKVRQAVNWAIDRRSLAKLNSGTIVPMENILPPAMPGYVQHDLYPHQDMAKAKQLIAESGIPRGEHVSFWCKTTDADEATAQYMQGVLDSLGFVTDIKCLDNSGYRAKIGDEHTKAQIGTETWSQDYPEAGDFIDVLLNGEKIVPQNSNNESWFNDPQIDREIDAADAEPDQTKRNAMWAKLDKEIMQLAPWAPYGYSVNYSFVSKRYQNVVFSPVYQLLFTQAKLTGTSGGAS